MNGTDPLGFDGRVVVALGGLIESRLDAKYSTRVMNMLLVDLLLRWAHVGAAIVLIGGAVFTRFVLLPAAAELPDDQHLALKERLRTRWSKIVAGGILVLLVSGLFNYLHVRGQHKGQAVYHAVMGTKILLALGAFFLASVLSGRSAKFAPLRENSRKWLLVLIGLTGTVAAMGSYLKVAVKPLAPSASTAHSDDSSSGKE